jgi:hypothetical protein
MTNNTPWIEWNGGECPVPPGTRVDLRFRNGAELESYPQDTAEVFYWRHDDHFSDIVAYRVHVEGPMEAEKSGAYLAIVALCIVGWALMVAWWFR